MCTITRLGRSVLTRSSPARQASALYSLRAALYIFLTAAAAALGAASWLTATAADNHRFFDTFAAHSVSAGLALAERVAVLGDGGLLVATSAFGLALPLASLPSFAALANATSVLTLASHIAFNPVVSASQLPNWLAWAEANAPPGASFPGALLLLHNDIVAPGVPSTPFSVPVWQARRCLRLPGV